MVTRRRNHLFVCLCLNENHYTKTEVSFLKTEEREGHHKLFTYVLPIYFHSCWHLDTVHIGGTNRQVIILDTTSLAQFHAAFYSPFREKRDRVRVKYFSLWYLSRERYRNVRWYSRRNKNLLKLLSTHANHLLCLMVTG